MLNYVLCVAGVAIIITGIVLTAMRKIKKIAATVIILLGIGGVTLSQSFMFVESGYTGVRITFGQISEDTVPNGLNWKLPFVQTIKTIDNRLKDFRTADTDDAIIESTVEGKIVIKVRDITVSYNINKEKSAYIYLTVSDMNNLLTRNIISSAIKSVTPNYTPEEVVKRTNVEQEMVKMLKKYADDKYGENVLLIKQVTIGDIGFTDDYNQAVAEKNNAIQVAEKQDIENQKNIDMAKANVEVATEEAKAKKIAAQGEKDANDLLEKSLTNAILTSMWIERWDGKMPVVTNGNGDSTIIDISTIIETEETEETEETKETKK